jgi:hypothetical protein
LPLFGARSGCNIAVSFVDVARPDQVVVGGAMAIGSGDRFKLVCYLGGVKTFEAFWAACPAEERGGRKTLQKSFNAWSAGRGFKASQDKIVTTVMHKGWPPQNVPTAEEATFPTPEILLHKAATVPEYLDLCKLKYEEVESLLSEEARKEWAANHHNLYFMDALDKESKKPRAQELMPTLKGTYRLYRRHSMLPGLLCESFTIEKFKDGHCEGWYYQFNRANSVNVIPFNAFFCQFYVIAFGAHQAQGQRTEIVTVSVHLANAFSEEKLVCSKDNRFFIGLLTGIYDSVDVLLAERVLVERVSTKVLIPKPSAEGASAHAALRDYAPTQITKDDRIRRGDYMKAIDAIDNSIDGQTLAVRPERIELVLDTGLVP